MLGNWKNILIVAGSGQNVGKTTYICRLIDSLKSENPIAIKISPHFHQPTEGLKILSEEKHFNVYEEKSLVSNKDSSRYLQHGAKRSFYIQAEDSNIKEAFFSLYPYLDSDCPILVESAALHKYINGGYFLFIHNKQGVEKPSTQSNLLVADVIVESDGKTFSINPEQIKFEGEWKTEKQ